MFLFFIKNVLNAYLKFIEVSLPFVTWGIKLIYRSVYLDPDLFNKDHSNVKLFWTTQNISMKFEISFIAE